MGTLRVPKMIVKSREKCIREGIDAFKYCLCLINPLHSYLKRLQE